LAQIRTNDEKNWVGFSTIVRQIYIKKEKKSVVKKTFSEL